jgi:hypothetical protein
MNGLKISEAACRYWLEIIPLIGALAPGDAISASMSTSRTGKCK